MGGDRLAADIRRHDHGQQQPNQARWSWKVEPVAGGLAAIGDNLAAWDGGPLWRYDELIAAEVLAIALPDIPRWDLNVPVWCRAVGIGLAPVRGKLFACVADRGQAPGAVVNTAWWSGPLTTQYVPVPSWL